MNLLDFNSGGIYIRWVISRNPPGAPSVKFPELLSKDCFWESCKSSSRSTFYKLFRRFVWRSTIERDLLAFFLEVFQNFFYLESSLCKSLRTSFWNSHKCSLWKVSRSFCFSRNTPEVFSGEPFQEFRLRILLEFLAKFLDLITGSQSKLL